MILSKQVAVAMNLVHCELKQFTSSVFRQNGIDMTPEQFLLLDLLWNEGTMSQQQIADTLQKDKNSITKLVDALERKELVTRKTDSQDRRSNRITLTTNGEAIKNEMKGLGISIVDHIIENIPKDDVDTFLNVLHKMSDNMKNSFGNDDFNRQ